MAKTALELTAEEKKQYRPLAAIRARRARTADERQARWQAARLVSERAATLLREQFDATSVVLFGSAARPETFTPWSDIDLAVAGVARTEFFRAVAAVTALSPDFQIDLVDPADCSPDIRRAIDRDGVTL